MDFDEYKPTISIGSKDLPEIKKWEVGESYDIIVSVKMTGLHEREGGQLMAEFQVEKAIGAGNDPMELEDINNLASDKDFLRESGSYRAKNQT